MNKKHIINKYAEKNNFSIESVEKEFDEMVNMLVRFKYYNRDEAIELVGKGLEVSLKVPT